MSLSDRIEIDPKIMLANTNWIEGQSHRGYIPGSRIKLKTITPMETRSSQEDEWPADLRVQYGLKY